MDQLQTALEHWVTSCPEASHSYLEENILAKSEVYNYYKEHPREGENSKSKTEKAESGEQFLQDATFSNLLKEVIKCVGHIGAQRLVRKYRELNVDTFTDSQIATLTGQSFLNLLQQEDLLTDDMESLSRLKKALDDSLLLRASHLVNTYVNKNDPWLQQLISTTSRVISYDWEIFAIEDLSLETETVKEIIRAHSDVSDQLRAALDRWVTSCPDASKSYLEENILPKSKVYDCNREHPREGENSKSSAKFLQDATFSNLLKEVVKCIGLIGAQRLVRKYRELNVDTPTDSQIATLTGQSFLNLLQKENLWTDDMESLSRLKKALDDSLLFRASHLVDTYITKKEKLEKNLSPTETVLQQIT
ncbi:hypothetical protein HOLleu_22225 [Holothuria leucospilota]|uniref:Uncharacterized protein n=1 Tax=Holothuria leucospilota TaxID=206669 RepID=A0A9Q1BYX6_HOLLE|nr:hypothetical protein HOLleu_22225 [Holothuria leucospilota]